MDVRAEKAKIWRKDYKTKDGKEFYRYSVSVSKKTDDGYVNAYIPVMFSKKSGAPEKIDNGALCAFEGFMSVDSYTNKEGNARNTPMIVIMKADFGDADSFAEAEVDIPF